MKIGVAAAVAGVVVVAAEYRLRGMNGGYMAVVVVVVDKETGKYVEGAEFENMRRVAVAGDVHNILIAVEAAVADSDRSNDVVREGMKTAGAVDKPLVAVAAVVVAVVAARMAAGCYNTANTPCVVEALVAAVGAVGCSRCSLRWWWRRTRSLSAAVEASGGWSNN